MVSDKELLEIYQLELNEEPSSILYLSVDQDYELKQKAYDLGRLDAIAGDDVSTVDLQEGNFYLLRKIAINEIIQLEIILVTEKAVQVRFNEGAKTWIFKEELKKDYFIVEDIKLNHDKH
jgi:hypothetical protein